MRKLKFRVFDYHEGKVLYDNQIPVFGKGLLESLRLLSGQTYALSQYTDNLDIDGNEIYEGDIVEILDIVKKENPNKFEFEYIKKAQGRVTYSFGAFRVQYVDRMGQGYELSLTDRHHEFRIIGNDIEEPVKY